MPFVGPHPADRWLRQQTPRRGWLLGDIRAVTAHCPPIRDVPYEPGRFGRTFEYGLHFDLSTHLPHVDKLRMFPRRHARAYARLAGFGPPHYDRHAPWPTWLRRVDRRPTWHRLHLPAYTLAFLHDVIRKLASAGPARRGLLGGPRVRDIVLANAAGDEDVFTTFMDGYAATIRPVLRGWGTVTAAPTLPGGRTADLRIGDILIEVKTGWLLGDDEVEHLVDQLLGYALLSQLADQPVQHVVAYLARYQMLLRYPFQTLVTRCAEPDTNVLDMATTYLALY